MNRSRGFTLIEVLVAMAIFGVMSVLAYGALGQSLNNAEMLNERMDRTRAIQQTMRLLGQDLRQVAPRPVRDTFGEGWRPAIVTSLGSDFAIELSRSGWPNPAGLPRATQQRVAYRIQDDELVRVHWLALDPTISDDPVATVLLEDIDSIVFNFVDTSGEVSEVWPPTGNGQTAPNLLLRPRAVEVVLTLPDEGELRRWFEVSP
jgi:general secretion pathway protein J